MPRWRGERTSRTTSLRHLRQASTLDLPDQGLARPVATVAETIGEATQQQRVADVDPAAADGVDGGDREITDTLRLIGGPVDSRLAPVTAPVIAALVPGTRGVRTTRPMSRSGATTPRRRPSRLTSDSTPPSARWTG